MDSFSLPWSHNVHPGLPRYRDTNPRVYAFSRFMSYLSACTLKKDALSFAKEGAWARLLGYHTQKLPEVDLAKRAFS